MSLTKVTYSMIQGAPLNILDYGAIGDGTTDNTAAIQAAITAAYGKTLFFPSGTYLCSDLTVTGNISFVGEPNTIIKYKDAGTTALVSVTGTSITFESDGITYNGNYTGQTGTVYSIKFSSTGTVSEPSNIRLINNKFIDGNYADVTIGTDSSLSTIENVYIIGNQFLGGKEGTDTGDYRYLNISSGTNLFVEHNYFDFIATPTSHGRAGFVFFVSGYTGVGARGSISNNTFVKVGRSTTATAGVLGAIDGYYGATNLSINGNTLINPYGRGIQIKSNAYNVTVNDNNVNGLGDLTAGASVDAQITVNRSTTTAYGGSWVIADNTCVDSGHDGITVSCANSDFTNVGSPVSITGNIVTNATRYGIAVLNSPTAIIANNIVKNGCTDYGIYVWDSSKTTGLITIDGNSISGVANEGIYIRNCVNLNCTNNILQNNTNYDLSIGSVTSGYVTNNSFLSTKPFEYGGTLVSYAGVVFENNKCTTAIDAGMYRAAIATGSAPAICNFLRLNTEGGTASDDLDTLSNGYEGMVIVLMAFSASNVVTVKNGTGNLKLASDFALSNENRTITLTKVGANWYEMCRSANT